MTDTQLLHKANGIRRIKECLKQAKMELLKPNINWDKFKIDASVPPINISMDEIEHIEPVPLKSGDKRVIVNGRPLSQDFRIIHEEQYQLLISNIKNIKIIRNF